MKKIIYRKLLTDCVFFSFLFLLSLSIIIWVFQAVNYLDIMIEDGRDYLIYFHFTLLNLPKIISKKGIINVGGDTQSVFNFAKKYNNKIIPIKLTKKNKLPLNQTMSLKKLKAIINKKKN